ncbi:hypothetical protein [Desulfosporosinus shakirovi]|nr:hypothetical protein [Desulfosporosinus sp. SRJS8]MCB8815021.1 hypothetical protein [Desulfosporosinus sp. SRJS8]
MSMGGSGFSVNHQNSFGLGLSGRGKVLNLAHKRVAEWQDYIDFHYQ